MAGESNTQADQRAVATGVGDGMGRASAWRTGPCRQHGLRE